MSAARAIAGTSRGCEYSVHAIARPTEVREVCDLLRRHSSEGRPPRPGYARVQWPPGTRSGRPSHTALGTCSRCSMPVATDDTRHSARRLAPHLGHRMRVRRWPAAVRLDERRASKAQTSSRDPRFAIHGPTFHPEEGKEGEWPGEAKIAGRAVLTGRIATDEEGEQQPDGEMFPLHGHHRGRDHWARRCGRGSRRSRWWTPGTRIAKGSSATSDDARQKCRSGSSTRR